MAEIDKSWTSLFQNHQLLDEALTHRSAAFETKPPRPHNERLELLGDAVLGLVVTDQLLKIFPKHAEGDLSKARSALVNESALCTLAKEKGLDELIRLGRGEMAGGGSRKPRILAGAYEAAVGAFYLDGGLPAAEAWVLPGLQKCLEGITDPARLVGDFKTKLQELVQEKHKSLPRYVVIREEGPPHDRVFEVQVFVDSKMMGCGSGRTKKEAEQGAAFEAFQSLTGKNS